LTKIDRVCATACRHNFQYIWIDNVCIDKSSSTELSEAINSMYKWYRNAERCYVYLSDFDSGIYDNRPTNGSPFTAEQIAKMQNCKWFTRGWTLQELLAPRQVLFYDRDWLYFGKLDELTLALSSVTRIPEALLSGKTRVFDYTAAQKMSWAATRTTTREEDMAYCLFGLFEVNLPLFYGEGARRAFIRFQEAIIQESNDLSLFAWQSEDSTDYRGIMARSPKEFIHAGDIVHLSPVTKNPEFVMTNKGLKIEMMVKKGKYSSFMPLNCGVKKDATVEPYGIHLTEFSTVVVRDWPFSLQFRAASESNWSTELFYVAKDLRVPKRVCGRCGISRESITHTCDPTAVATISGYSAYF
jgi:hypothetical protein